MKAFWQQCEGQIIDGFPLRQYLGGDEDHAVFLTEYGGETPRRAAIKLIHADPETTESQLRRWRLAADLSHPNLIRLVERGHWQLNKVPLLYLVMEYADEDLSQVIPERPLTIDETRQMLEPALSALAYLHSNGFVHGRLKPSNFMAIGNQLKLSCDSVTNAGGGVRPADDVWSLGMTLVEALTQRRPTGPRDGMLPEGLPAEFREIVRKSLPQDPRGAESMSETPERSNGGSGRQIVVALAGVVLLLLAMVAGIRLMHRSEPAPAPPSQPQPAQPQPTPPQPSRVAPPPQPRPAQRQPAAPAIPGGVVHEVLPEILPRARTSIQGKVAVSVRVEVDPSGNVTSATLESPGPSEYFSGRALEASKQWKFAPADVPRAWLLRFQFTRAGTKVAPLKATP